jgi:hypothetical protein
MVPIGEVEQLDLGDLIVGDLVHAQRPEHGDQVLLEVHVHVGAVLGASRFARTWSTTKRTANSANVARAPSLWRRDP